jgi:hypothetical protein
MPELLPYVLIAVTAVAVWCFGLIFLDIFTPADVRAWRRLSSLRGYVGHASILTKAVERAPALHHVQRELDLQRLLALAGKRESPLGFLGRSSSLAVGACAVLFTADSLARALSGDWPIAPWLIVAAGLALLPLSIVHLRLSAHRAQDGSTRTLGDMMMIVAVMTDARGFQLDDAIRILSRCSRDLHLRDLLDREGFRRLVPGAYKSTVEKYQLVGDRYAIPELVRLSEAAASANIGIAERDIYTQVALTIYRERLAEARMRSARAKILVTLPVAGMLIPLLLLIGAPTFSAISSGIQGG